jgi:putative tryptophan/tyrosine transport system substrate-binding protein
MKRRHVLKLAAGACVATRASPLPAQSAAAGLRRVAVLAPSTRAKEELTLKPFFEQMRALGWVEGQNIGYDRVYADDRHQDLPRLAAEVVARTPELIYAPPQIAAMAARQATRTIAIVFATGIDPVQAGLAASLAHPGGNVTGIVSVIDSLAPKRLELLREILPQARRIGLLGDPKDPRLYLERDALAPATAALGLTTVVAEASNPAELDAAMAKLIGQGVDVVIGTTSIITNLRGRVVELANRSRLPVVGSIAEMAEAGALFAYGPPLVDQIRRSAHLVDRILKGAKPADLAIEQPTRFDLVINLKAARLLGITIPRSLLLRADEVIQ